MANDWNPNYPDVLGEEWKPALYGTNFLASSPWGQRIRSRSASLIDSIAALFQAADSSNTGNHTALIEIIPAGQEVPATGTATTFTYLPNADNLVEVGWHRNTIPTQVNLYQNIDEGPPYNDADYVWHDGTVTGAPNPAYRIEFNSGAHSLTSRVTGITVEVRTSDDNPGSSAVFNLALHHSSGSTYYIAQPGFTTIGASFVTQTFNLGELNPKTFLPWTPQDVRDFDNGTWTVQLEGSNSTVHPQFSGVTLYVQALPLENRVAVGSVVVTGGAFVPIGNSIGRRTGQLQSYPSGTDNWSKPASGDFTLLFRQPYLPTGFVLAQWMWCQGNWTVRWSSEIVPGSFGTSVLCPVPGVKSASGLLANGILIDTTGVVTHFDPDAFGNGRTVSMAMIKATGSPQVDDDSITYCIGVDGPNGNNTESIFFGHTWEQDVTPSSNQSFLLASVCVDPRSAVEDLEIRVKRRSDNVQFGGVATITADEARALPQQANGMRNITALLSSAASLVSGTQYYIEVSTTDLLSSTGWRAFYLGSTLLAGAGVGGSTTFGGGGDDLTKGGVDNTLWDGPFTLISQPAGPPSVTGTVSSIAFAASGGPCVVDSYDAVDLVWPQTSLGATFLRYEIQRSEDAGITWVTIGYGTAETMPTFRDVEGIRGIASIYRVRAIRSDGAYSAWSTLTASLTPHLRGSEVLFTSNEAWQLTCAYNYEPENEFTFLAESSDVLTAMYGRNNLVAFMEAEDRGMTWPLKLSVNAVRNPLSRLCFPGPSLRPGIPMFDPIRAISRAALSYVAVLDHYQERFFTHLQVKTGDIAQPNHKYFAKVQLTLVSDDPSIAIQDCPVPAITLFGAPNQLGLLEGVDEMSKFSFQALAIPTWSFPVGTAVYFAYATPNGHILIGSVPTTNNNLQPTGRTQSYADFNPGTGKLRTVKLTSTTGLTDTVRDGSGSPGTGGADISDFQLVNLPGGPAITVVSQTTNFEWDLTVMGRYRALLRLTQDANGDWQPDYSHSWTYDQLQTLDPTNGTNAFPNNTNTHGQTLAHDAGLNELEVLPNSGYVVTTHYFGPGTSPVNSGAISIFDPDTGIQKAWLHLPAATLPNGTPVTVAPREVIVDPTSAPGDERFVVFTDAFIATGGSTPAPYFECSYDGTTTITIKSGTILPQYASSRSIAGAFLSDGTLVVAQQDPSGFGLGTKPMAWWPKIGGERGIVSRQPFNGNSFTTEWGSQPAPDYASSATTGPSTFPFSGVRHAGLLKGIVGVGPQGLLWWLKYDPAFVFNNLVANPTLNVNASGWASFFTTGTVAWDSGNGGRLKFTENGTGASSIAGYGSFDLPSDAQGRDITGTLTVRSGGTRVPVRVGFDFRDPSDTSIFVSEGDYITEPVTGSTLTLTHAAVVPAGATKVRLTARWNSHVNGEVHYIEKGADGIAGKVGYNAITEFDTVQLDVLSAVSGAAITSSLIRVSALDSFMQLWVPLQGLDNSSNALAGLDSPPQWLWRVDLKQLIPA